MTMPSKTTIAILSVVIIVGFWGARKALDGTKNHFKSQATEHHTTGVLYDQDARDHAVTANTHAEILMAYEAKIDDLKSRLSKARSSITPATSSSPAASDVQQGDDVPGPEAIDAIKDQIIETQDLAIKEAKAEAGEYKAAYEKEKLAYEEECRARRADQLAHEAAMIAAKSGNAKWFIIGLGIGFGGGKLGVKF